MLREEPVAYHLEKSSREFRSYRLEFIAGQFKHNTAVSLLLGPCILPLFALSGKLTLTILLCGLVISYILDYLNFKGWTLVTIWATVGSVWLSLYFSNVLLAWKSLFNVFILANSSGVLVLLGIWATVQFRWLQVHSPEVALVCERILIGISPFLLLPLMYTIIVGTLGVRKSAVLCSLCMCAMHHLMYKRRKSSWKVALVPAASDEEFVQGRLECVAFTLSLPAVPVALFWVTQHGTLTLSWLDALSLASLVAIPVYYALFDAVKALWFLFPNGPTGGPPTKAQIAASPVMAIRKLALLLSFLCILHWFQQTVLSSRYGHFLLGIPPPYNLLALTIASYSLSLTAYLALQLVRLSTKGELGIGVAGRWIAVLFLSIAGSTALAMVLGVPRFILPFAALSTACITAYCLDRRNFNNFVLFAGSSSVMLVWWMFKSFSFLEMDLPVLLGAATLTLQQLSFLIVGLFVSSCMLFPVSFGAYPGAPEIRVFFAFLLFLHACLFAFVEHILYSQAEPFYSPAFVLISSVVGCIMLVKVHQNGKLTYPQASIAMAPYISKAVVYLSVACTDLEDHHTATTRAYLGAEALVLFVQVIICATIVLIHEFELYNNKKRSRPNLAILYSVSSFAVVLLSRRSIVAALIQIASGGSALAEVSSTRFVGLMIFIWGLTLIPVSFKYMKHLQLYRKATAMVIIMGAILGLLSPAWGALYTGTNLDDDIRLYQAPWWIGWTGTLAGALLVCTLFNIIPLPHAAAVRYSWWAGITTLSAITFSETFLPYVQLHTTLCICVIFGLVALTIDLAHFPRTTKDFTPAVIVYGAMLAVSLLVYIAVERADYQDVTQVQYILLELYHVSTVAVLSLIATSNLLVAVIIKAKLSGVPLVRSVYTTAAKDVNFLVVPTKATLTLGLIVNASCLTGFLSMAMLNVMLNESNVFVFVLLSGLLLLLHQDAYLFATFQPDRQRYVPALVNVQTLLTMIALLELYSAFFLGRLVWNLSMLLLAAPSHAVLWSYLNTAKPPSVSGASSSAALGLLAILGTTMPSVRWLAMVGTAGLGGIFLATAIGAKQQSTLL